MNRNRLLKEDLKGVFKGLLMRLVLRLSSFSATRILCILFCLSLLFSYAVPALAAQEAPIVKVIEIKGMKRVDEGAIRKRLSQKAGQPLAEDNISKDIKSIYKMGYFEDVRVEAEPFEGGLKIIYIVKEKPTIVKVGFQGNREYDDDKLREQITITSGAIEDATLIRDNVHRLRVFYEGEGYWLAGIVPVVRKITENEVSLTFLIKEGEKVKIKEIRIKGNQALSDREIKKVMQTKSWGLLSFITSAGYYKESEMKADIERIRNLYYDNGYLNVVVSGPETKLTPDRTGMIVSLTISEGPQYRVSTIRFAGNKAYDDKTLMAFFPLRSGEVFSRKKLREGIRKITDFYSEKGYALASAEPDIVPDEKAHKVSIIMNIDEGDIFRVGRIEISGNSRTKDKVIRREMRLDEGDIFNSKLLRRSYERINNLNFFETVDLVPKPEVEKKVIDIDIKVKEKATGFLSIGGGYSTVDRLVAMLDLTQGNLFGTGRYIKLKGEFGGRSTFYEISYKDPWFLDRPVSLTLSAYNTERDYIGYNKKATGGSVGFGKRFNDYWSSSLGYRYEQVTIFNVSEDASNIIKEQIGTNITSSITPAVVRDSRDNYLDPSNGSRNSLFVTYSGLGGDNYFVKGLLDSKWFFPVGETTVSLRGRVGYASGLFDRKLPLYERFYVGGMYTIRGLDFGEGGPRDENGDVIGGTKELLFNAEYIVPLLDEIRLKGVVFFDLGRAYGSSETFGSDLRYTTGAGIRWVSPIGPIRIEYGYNIDRRDDESTGRIEFAFGSFF
ncbi:MAG: outer membrane protein assembly factor BamA [Nitrospirota bacterium]|nr:outer membrane protein assembly factor BamA [Nitrospirota bacterium]